MKIDAIPLGKKPPHDVNVIVEVPLGGEPIKYEMDKESGALVVDRFLYTPMFYPGNYGFIPHTLSGDGDPCDVLVANTRAVADRDVAADDEGKPGIDVHDHALLDIGAIADADRLVVTAQSRAEPDADIEAEMHAADHLRVGRDPDPGGVGEVGDVIVEGVERHGGLSWGSGLTAARCGRDRDG